MKRKVAIIDPLGAHGSSQHLYLFGQVMGLINSGVSVSFYDNTSLEIYINNFIGDSVRNGVPIYSIRLKAFDIF